MKCVLIDASRAEVASASNEPESSRFRQQSPRTISDKLLRHRTCLNAHRRPTNVKIMSLVKQWREFIAVAGGWHRPHHCEEVAGRQRPAQTSESRKHSSAPIMAPSVLSDKANTPCVGIPRRQGAGEASCWR